MKFIVMLVCLCSVSLAAPSAEATGPALTLGGVGLPERPPTRDPALAGVHIDVSSSEPAHRAPQVGAAANRALSTLSLPRPVPRFAPPAAHVRTLVGIDTWFWVPAFQWRPIVRFVAAGGVVVTLVATPIALQLRPGDGSALVSCPGPGSPWLVPGSRSLCSHVFQRASTATASGRYRAAVQAVWTIRWTSSTGLSGVVGPVVVSRPVSLVVAEAQAVLSR
ncbi:hypothetical protein [Candidatus Poriferisodalis sp.]|uniref:hypothetical protein n=1 Tax=Candidatus Poriferisodalis sp. TaxID=3101277 RepID=UPI003B5AEF82